jgi:hypothetical protein
MEGTYRVVGVLWFRCGRVVDATRVVKLPCSLRTRESRVAFAAKGALRTGGFGNGVGFVNIGVHGDNLGSGPMGILQGN